MNASEKLISAYHQMLNRLKDTFQHTRSQSLGERIQAVQEKAIILEELTLEEAERVGQYLQRDLQDAAQFISETEQELADWMRFDLSLIEEQLLEKFSILVDHTRLELDNLAEQARLASEWYSGEITGPGTLVCIQCGKLLHFHQPDYIPACPNCGATLFKRVVYDDNL